MTTVVNLGTDDLVIRKGDIIARAHLTPEYTEEDLEEERGMLAKAQVSTANKQFERFQTLMQEHSQELKVQQ